MCRYMRLPIAFRDNQQISLADLTISDLTETEGYSLDPWPEVDQALEEVFNREYED